MKLDDGRITFLVNSGETTIRITDGNSSFDIIKIKLTPEQLSQALSRLGETKCKVEVNEWSLDKLNKKMLVDHIQFEIPNDVNWKEKKEVAYKEGLKHCPKGWVLENYFNSQDSFVYRDGKTFVNATIRKWE